MHHALSMSAGIVFALSALDPRAFAAVESSMITPAGTSASITVTMTIQTALGTSTDSDVKTMPAGFLLPSRAQTNKL